MHETHKAGDGVAKQQLDLLSHRLHTEFVADEALDGSRVLVLSAIKSSNGSTDKIKDMAETQGLLVHFMVQEKLRTPDPITPDQLKQALLEVHDAACPLGEVVTTDVHGRRRIDPVKLLSLLPSTAKDVRVEVQEDGAAVSLSFKEGLKAHGFPAVVFACVVAILFTVGGMVYAVNKWQTTKMQTMMNALDAKFQTMSAEVAAEVKTQITN